MFDLLIRLTKHYLLRFIQLPVSLWINVQWANLRYRETCHLLRLDDYLLQDMGLKKVDGRIEAIDTSRMDSYRNIFALSSSTGCDRDRVRHAN